MFRKRGWVFLHAVSGMLFSGGIVISTLLEWWIVNQTNQLELWKFWFTQVSSMDKLVVVPSLTLSMISGMAQTALDYGSMVTAPKHIRLALHIIATFGLWWASTDLTTQKRARKAVLDHAATSTTIPTVLILRRWSNVVSCLLVGVLYALMGLKPGYKG